MLTIEDYPDLEKFVDNTEDYENTFSETIANGVRFLTITQRSDFDGGQILFQWDGDAWHLVDSDTFVDVSGIERTRILAGSKKACSRSSDVDHDNVYTYLAQQVNKFSSKNGPDSGNLACVWTVRHIVYNALGRWITRTDGTSVFDAELQQCYGSTWQEADTQAGGITISPTSTMKNGRRNIGHVGLLGPAGKGGGRKIYSNSSSRARWEQNFTLESWIARYRTKKGLKVRFYPLPLYA